MHAIRATVLGLMVMGAAGFAAAPARADGHDGWHGGWHRGWHQRWHRGDDDDWEGPRWRPAPWGVVVAPRVAYPPPVYYAPPPPPPPVYYAPPPPVVFAPGLTVGIGIR